MHDDINQLLAERQAKLARWRETHAAFPNDFQPEHEAGVVEREHGAKSREELAATPVRVKFAGRMMLKRVMGKASFATLQDASGRLQIYLTDEHAGTETHEQFKHWDIGDILGTEGELFKTKTGELSLRVSTCRLLVKSLRPLPDKFHGLEDVETRYRQRYVDLIVTPASRERFIKRGRIIQHMREHLVSQGFLEVETPMLHPIPGGAAARPFVTHHNALDQDMYLRVAPELYLKRLVVGGFERVFEINRNFRNEGVSPRHNPEFTMLEFYRAWWNYRDVMDYTERLLRDVTQAVLGTTQLRWGEHALDLGAPFARLSLADAIRTHAPQYANANLDDTTWLHAELQRLGEPPAAHVAQGALLLLLFEAVAEAKLVQPTFILDYPVEVSPLARASDARPGITERFELFVCGREIANGFSELNDPQDQAQRFRDQVAQKEAGDHEAMYFDADYIAALEYGMPATGGCGIGIDRLTMMLTDAPSIRDVILFPALKRLDD